MAVRPGSAIIIGGGVSGLTMAALLSERGLKVTVLEAQGHLGGRTFSFKDQATGQWIDNGQHLLMGCYEFTLKWLKLIGSENLARPEPNLRIAFLQPGMRAAVLNLPNIPSPFHMLYGMLVYPNLTLDDKLQIMMLGLKAQWAKLPSGISVSEWLMRHGQSTRSQKYFWEPTCLGVMNDLPQNASASLFVTAVRQMFFKSREFSKMIVPVSSLDDLLIKPAQRYIESKGGIIRRHAPVKALRIVSGKIEGVVMRTGEELFSDMVIASVPSWHINELLPPEWPRQESIRTSPIISAYMWFDGVDVEKLFEGKFIGSLDTTIQWLFKKPGNGLEVTTSAASREVEMDREQLLAIFTDELRSLFPEMKNAILRHCQILKERNATFCEPVKNDTMRWNQKTTLKNFYIIGDWTRTGLPSTIESAVKSAFLADQAILGEATL